MRIPAFLLLLLLSILWESGAYGRGSTQTWVPATASAPSCTLDVVLVTFDDATTPAGGYDYHLHDRPHGSNDGTYPDPDSSYTLRDFERLFIGGYDPLQDLPFVGDTVTVGNRVTNRDTLPEVFGSVRAYYDSVSNEAFQLHVRMINPADADGFPHWVELPQTKDHYAEIDIGAHNEDDFWNDAYDAAWDSVQSWNANITDYSIADLPNASYTRDRRIRHKIVYLYSGAIYSRRSPLGILHPQADRVTHTLPTGQPTRVGYRYVMGEREGWGSNDHDIDRFAGIGTHAHEIGHLLGLTHGDGLWTVSDNQYLPGTQQYTNDGGANMLGWTLMQGGGEQGPILEDNGYYVGYRSCPNPINPFYLMDLGWINPSRISESRDNYAIAAGTTHRIDRGGVSYLLNRRTLQPFGGRYLAFYDYAAPGNEDQGLMIWRREIGGEERPILIVADERRYRDARPLYARREYFDMLSDPFPGTANVTAVNALTGGVGLRQATAHSIDSNGNSRGENMDPNSLDLALTNITYDRTTDMITVDIYMAPPGPPTNLTAVVSNGQATLSWQLPAPSDSGPQPPPPSYEYRQSADGGATWGAEIAVAEGRTDARSQTISGLVDGTDYAFAVRAVNPVGSSDWVRPLVLEGPTAIEFPEVVSPESSPRTVANYTATDPEGDTITWLLSGTDAEDFLLSSSGLLTFQSSPDFEEPTDRNHPPGQEPPTDEGANNIYQVTVQASAGQQSAALDVIVTVENADDPGVVSLDESSPQVGVPLTAELIDQDGGVREVNWQWQGQAPDATTWTTLSSTSGSAQSSYTPQVTQLGWALRAVVTSYRDSFDAGKRAESLETAPVQAWSGVVSFGAGSYQAPEGGASVSIPVSLSPAPPQTVDIPVQVSADAGTETGDYAVAGLTNGTLSFAASVSSQSFRITANEDADNADETVSLSFGSLPTGVAVGTTDQATVTLDDDDGVVSLSSLSSQVGIQLTAELTDPRSRSGGTRGSRRSSSKAAWENAPRSSLPPSGPFLPRSIWQWQHRLSSTAAWATAPGSASQSDTWTSTYTPVEADVDYFLRATVRYATATGADTAYSSATEAVQAAPGPAPTHPPSFDPDDDPVAYSVQAGSTLNATLPAAEGADFGYGAGLRRGQPHDAGDLDPAGEHPRRRRELHLAGSQPPRHR